MSVMIKDVPPDAAPLDAEFRKLFWKARRGHMRLKDKASFDDPTHQAVIDFAKENQWHWAETLVEASRLDCAGQLKPALDAVKQCESEVPEHYRSYLEFVRGSAYQTGGNLDEVIKAYRKAVEDPFCDAPGNAWNNLGNVLLDKGDVDGAIEAFRKVVADPNCDVISDGLYNLGVALSKKGDYSEAVKAFKTALEDPKCERPGNVWNKLAMALAETGDLDGSVEAFRTSLNIQLSERRRDR